MQHPPLTVTCAWLERGGLVLLARRADSGLWELPGGKAGPGESLAACLQRELCEELGIRTEAGPELAMVEHPGPPALRLHCLACRLLQGEPTPLEHRELAWLAPDQLPGRNLCPADRVLIGIILAAGA